MNEYEECFPRCDLSVKMTCNDHCAVTAQELPEIGINAITLLVIPSLLSHTTQSSGTE